MARTAETDGRHERCEARAVQAVVQRTYEQLRRSEISEGRQPVRDEWCQRARAEGEEQGLGRREDRFERGQRAVCDGSGDPSDGA